MGQLSVACLNIRWWWAGIGSDEVLLGEFVIFYLTVSYTFKCLPSPPRGWLG